MRLVWDAKGTQERRLVPHRACLRGDFVRNDIRVVVPQIMDVFAFPLLVAMHLVGVCLAVPAQFKAGHRVAEGLISAAQARFSNCVLADEASRRAALADGFFAGALLCRRGQTRSGEKG